MSKPSAFPSLVTCLFGSSRREQPENRANPMVCATSLRWLQLVIDIDLIDCQ